MSLGVRLFDHATFHHDVVGVRRVTVDRFERLLVILVEELLLAERLDLFVDVVEQFRVALLHRWRDRVHIT